MANKNKQTAKPFMKDLYDRKFNTKGNINKVIVIWRL